MAFYGWPLSAALDLHGLLPVRGLPVLRSVGRQWYEGIRPEHRIGSLNVYARLERANLWKHVARVVLPVPGVGSASPRDITASACTRSLAQCEG